ncbi:MAG: hypothetical protein JO126_02065 [Alphaproteobacteria bacterium]|nr:hypothetical protein [Alphaproteobacteria bacterium]
MGQTTQALADRLALEHEAKQRAGYLLDYLRLHQNDLVPNMSPLAGFAAAVSEPTQILGHYAREAGDALEVNSWGGALGLDGMMPDLTGLSGLMDQPRDNDLSGTWMTPGYHHRGFLPTHDAIKLGMTGREHFMDDFVRLEARPFVGENWLHGGGIYGATVSMNFGQSPVMPKNKLQAAMNPVRDTGGWGRISMGFVGGESELTDHGKGFDLHGEVRFTENLALHSGVRDNGDASANYVLLRWSMDLK